MPGLPLVAVRNSRLSGSDRRVGHLGRKIQSRRVAPQLLKAVEVALAGLEDVDNDVSEVDQHPRALIGALDSDRRQTGLLELELDLLGDRTYLAVVASGADDEVIGDNDEFTNVDSDDVLGLLVRCRLGRQPCEVT